MDKRLLCAVGGVMLLLGCSTQHAVEVKPVEVKPIHITIDVNIRVDRALDDFFGDIDEVAEDIDADVEQEQ
jgi:Skp family chaperone for outer membrane proteins